MLALRYISRLPTVSCYLFDKQMSVFFLFSLYYFIMAILLCICIITISLVLTLACMIPLLAANHIAGISWRGLKVDTYV